MQLYLSLEVARNIRLRNLGLKKIGMLLIAVTCIFTFKLSSDQTISNAFLLLFVFASRCGRSEIKLHGYFFLLLFTTFRFYFLYQEPPEAAKPSLLSKGVCTN